MAEHELTTEVILCSRCQRFGCVVQRMVGTRVLPTSWRHITSSGWGMTGYTNTETVCDVCLREEERP